MIRRLGVAVAVVALGGCGVDPPTDQERLAIDRLVEAELSGDEERCILAGLADLGITAGRIVDGDLNADEDGEVLAATLECVDDLAAVEGFVDSFIAGAAAEGTTLSRDEARCTIRAIQADDQNAAVLRRR